MLRHVFYSPRMSVPDNIVKQIAEGRPVVLALLCSGLRSYYLPTAEERLEIAGDPGGTDASATVGREHRLEPPRIRLAARRARAYPRQTIATP